MFRKYFKQYKNFREKSKCKQQQKQQQLQQHSQQDRHQQRLHNQQQQNSQNDQHQNYRVMESETVIRTETMETVRISHTEPNIGSQQISDTTGRTIYPPLNSDDTVIGSTSCPIGSTVPTMPKANDNMASTVDNNANQGTDSNGSKMSKPQRFSIASPRVNDDSKTIFIKVSSGTSAEIPNNVKKGMVDTSAGHFSATDDANCDTNTFSTHMLNVTNTELKTKSHPPPMDKDYQQHKQVTMSYCTGTKLKTKVNPKICDVQKLQIRTKYTLPASSKITTLDSVTSANTSELNLNLVNESQYKPHTHFYLAASKTSKNISSNKLQTRNEVSHPPPGSHQGKGLNQHNLIDLSDSTGRIMKKCSTSVKNRKISFPLSGTNRSPAVINKGSKQRKSLQSYPTGEKLTTQISLDNKRLVKDCADLADLMQVNITTLTPTLVAKKSEIKPSFKEVTTKLIRQAKFTKRLLGVDIILNVGGSIYITSENSLSREKGSWLSKRLSLMTFMDNRGRYFIDRNGELFSYILEYLELGELHLPTQFRELRRLKQEAAYYGLKKLVAYLERLNETKNNSSKGSYITLTTHSTYNIRFRQNADVGFRRISSVTVAGYVRSCRDVFGSDLSMDYDANSDYDRYSCRMYLTCINETIIFEKLTQKGYKLLNISQSDAIQNGKQFKQEKTKCMDVWTHVTNLYFLRTVET